jgi:hypothetical protein
VRVKILAHIEERAKNSYEASGNYACEGIGAICTVTSFSREGQTLNTYNQKIKAHVRRSRIPFIKSAPIYDTSEGLAPLVMDLSFWFDSTLIHKS